MTSEKRYAAVTGQNPKVLAALRSFLKNNLHLSTRTNIERKEGVAGVRYREYLEYQEHIASDGVVHLYSVLAGHADNHVQMISVFAELPEQASSELLRFLDSYQFARSFEALAERPGENRIFRGYLEKPPGLCAILNDFRYQEPRQAT